MWNYSANSFDLRISGQTFNQRKIWAYNLSSFTYKHKVCFTLFWSQWYLRNVTTMESERTAFYFVWKCTCSCSSFWKSYHWQQHHSWYLGCWYNTTLSVCLCAIKSTGILQTGAHIWRSHYIFHCHFARTFTDGNTNCFNIHLFIYFYFIYKL